MSRALIITYSTGLKCAVDGTWTHNIYIKRLRCKFQGVASVVVCLLVLKLWVQIHFTAFWNPDKLQLQWVTADKNWVSVHKIIYYYLYQFQAIVPFPYPLKTSGNLWYFMFSWSIAMEQLIWNELMLINSSFFKCCTSIFTVWVKFLFGCYLHTLWKVHLSLGETQNGMKNSVCLTIFNLKRDYF